MIPLHLTLSISGFFPREDGAERQLRFILEKLADDGFVTTVVTGGVEGRSAVDFVGPLRIIGVGRVDQVALMRKLTKWFMGLWRLFQSRPDVLLSSQLGVNTVMAAIIAIVLRKPHVVRLAGGSRNGFSESEWRSEHRLNALMLRGLLHRSHFVAPAEHLLTGSGSLPKLIRARSTVIPNGVLVIKETPPDLFTRPLAVAWVGRDNLVKGVPVLLEMAKRCATVTFQAIGIGRQPDAPPNIRFHGRLADPSTILEGCRVLLSTSSFEGSPNVVLEALGVGLPVVAFEIDGIREIADRYSPAIKLAPKNDLDAMAHLIQSTVNDPPSAEARPPSISEVAKVWSSLLRSLAGES